MAQAQPDTEAEPPLAEQLENINTGRDDLPCFSSKGARLSGTEAIVTPRAFLTEFGYHLEGTSVPSVTASMLVEREDTHHVANLIRSFSGSFDTYEDTRRMFDMDGYTQLRVYRMDYHPDPDADWIKSYGNGHYLFEYQYSRGEHERDVHDGSGYYIVKRHPAKALLYDLLLGGDDAYPEWATNYRPRTAAHEDWRVLDFSDHHLHTTLRDRLSDALLFEEGAP